ncbi:MAG: hypothetical protein J1F66_05370 [Clostridiales bacterium]|nr:hypothetical protein [Clostridiales bacterium]
MSDKSILILCSAIAFVILAASVTLAILFCQRKLKRFVRILGAGVFFMLIALIYPAYAINGAPLSFGVAILQGMQAMFMQMDPTSIFEMLNGVEVGFIGSYKVFLLILCICGPLFTLGITLSFFLDKFTRLFYRLRSLFQASFLFSEINERTLCVAEDIASKHKRALIVFAVRVKMDDIDAESLDRIKEIGASIINEDIVDIKHSLKHERNYYLLGADGSTNLDAGLRLYQKYNEKQSKNVNMWLYTREDISEVIFDHLYETFNVRLINEESLIARQLVTDYPLYNAVQDGKLSVLLVGGGRIGLEILRWATECSCLSNVEAEFTVIDKDADKAKATFEQTSPELSKHWKFEFLKADITSVSFRNTLLKIKPTYVVVALGEQNRNIQTALYVRRVYGITDGFPHIHALVDHERIKDEILPNLRISNWYYDAEKRTHKSELICDLEIKVFGSYEETYSDLRIDASYPNCLAVAVNATNCGINELNEQHTKVLLFNLYNQVMFYKNLSDGFAVSVPYKLQMMGLKLCEDGEGDISLLESRLPKHIDLLREQENRRYEAFMRGNGWTDMPVSEIRKDIDLYKSGALGDKLRKRNARLDNTNVKELEELTGRKFKQEDERAIRNLPTIIRLANELYGKKYSVREI